MQMADKYITLKNISPLVHWTRYDLCNFLFQTSAHPWNTSMKQFSDYFSFIIRVLKNMLMRLRQFQCFLSVFSRPY